MPHRPREKTPRGAPLAPPQLGRPRHEGCDVRLATKDQESPDSGCDVQLEPTIQPTVQDLINAFEEDPDHTMSAEEWREFLVALAREAYADRPLPRRRSIAEPGTEAKIRVMQERIERDECPFHPRDLRIDSNERAVRETRRFRNGRDEIGALRAAGETPPPMPPDPAPDGKGAA